MKENCNSQNKCEEKKASKNSQRNCTEELLEELIKNLVMGKHSLVNVISKAKNSKLADELTEQLDRYAAFCDDAKALLSAQGKEAKDENLVTKMSAKLGIEMNTLMDASDAHIAQMVIEGATMGITDTIRLVRDYENSNCSEEALSLARHVVSYQEKTVESMKKYL